MKNQDKKNALDFNRSSIIELNDQQVGQVVGGGTTIPCGIVWVAIETVVTKMEISFDMQV